MAGPEWFRLQPTDEQLVSFLEKKRLSPAFDDPIIKELNIYKFHPRELLAPSSISDEQACYFSCTLDPLYAKGKLRKRKAIGGSWKITCRGSKIMAKDSNKQIGVRRTLSFYEGSTTKKENRTDYKMYEYHEYPRQDNSFSQGEAVVCRIEKKPNKKRKSSSALDEGQTSDTFAYDSGNNVSEDILQVKPQLPQNLYLPSGYNNDIANSNLMEVETHPPPNHHISHVTKDIIQELEAPLPSNQYISSNGEDDTAKYVVPQMVSQLLLSQYMSPIIGDNVAKYIFPEWGSQLLPKQHVPPLIGDDVAKAIISQCESQLPQLPNFHGSSTIEDPLTNNCFSEKGTQLLPNQHTSSSFEDYVAKSMSSEIGSQLLANHQLSSNIENNAAKSFPSEVRPLVPALQDELVVCNRLDHNSFFPLQSPLCIPPGSCNSSSFSNDLVPLLNQNSLPALPSPIHLQPGCLYYGSSSNNSPSGLHPNSFSTLQPELSDYSGFSNYPTNGLDHKSFSALQFPIRPLPEFSYSINGLSHISALQSPVDTPRGSSSSSWFSNDSNVWTPQLAAEQEDDLANSHGPVQDDFHKLY